MFLELQKTFKMFILGHLSTLCAVQNRQHAVVFEHEIDNEQTQKCEELQSAPTMCKKRGNSQETRRIIACMI